jgi:hypothetical protein
VNFHEKSFDEIFFLRIGFSIYKIYWKVVAQHWKRKEGRKNAISLTINEKL